MDTEDKTDNVNTSTRQHFLNRVDEFCELHNFAHTRLSCAAAGRTGVIRGVRLGDSATLATIEKIERFMDGFEPPEPRKNRRAYTKTSSFWTKKSAASTQPQQESSTPAGISGDA